MRPAPDPGGPGDSPQWNITCDPSRGDFNTLVIHPESDTSMTPGSSWDPDLFITFMSADRITLTGSGGRPGPTPAQLRDQAEQGVMELLRAIDQDRTPGAPQPASRGRRRTRPASP